MPPVDYLVGDLQGCDEPLGRLLDTVGFSPSRDRLCVLGDLVNRGPQSLAVLRRLRDLGDAATCLLGNHDLHALAVAHGVRPPHRSDTLSAVLAPGERDGWVAWLRVRPLAVRFGGWLCVHAGVVPEWTADDTLARAHEVEQHLRHDTLHDFLPVMYGNRPDRWDDALAGATGDAAHGAVDGAADSAPASADRLRFIVNVLTRIRYLDSEGRLDFRLKEGASAAPPGYTPWFEAPGRRTAGVPMAFGHWSTLGLIDRPDLLALDTGCVWGGCLTAARVDGGRREIVQVRCEQAQRPG